MSGRERERERELLLDSVENRGKMKFVHTLGKIPALTLAHAITEIVYTRR